MAIQKDNTHKSLPLEKITTIINLQRICAKIAGADCLDPNYRITWRSIVAWSVAFFYFSFTFLTINKLFAENWKFILEATCMVGTVLHCMVKLACAYTERKNVAKLRFMVEEIYGDYQRRGSDYIHALNKNCERLKNIMIVLIVGYILTGAAIIGLPIILYMVYDSRYLIVHFHVPGLDLNTNMGYFGTLGAHLIFVFIGAFGLFAADGMVVLFFTQAYIFIHILKLQVSELNKILMDPRNAANNKVTLILKDIVKWHILYTDYTKLTNKTFYWVVTAQVTTTGISIVLTIFALFTSDWPGGYAYLIMTSSHLYIYCILGTKVEICNDQLRYEIYNILWYNMTVTQQKLVCLMLMKSQSPQLLNVADCMPLSVRTGLQITKLVYSFTMMMLQFFVD